MKIASVDTGSPTLPDDRVSGPLDVSGAAGIITAAVGDPDQPERTVWVFTDLPLGRACGPSYMIESWDRQLRDHGLSCRLFTPSTRWRERSRTGEAVTFRTLRHIGYVGDYHARFSCVAELYRARQDRPDVVLVATLGRVGLLGITLAARYRIPLVLVVSTDTTGAVSHYSATRVFSSGGVKPVVLLLTATRVRAALFRRSQQLRQGAGWAARVAGHCAQALHAQARELVLLSGKSVHGYTSGGDHAPRLTVLPVGVDRLPPSEPPSELVWREGALRVLYVGRLAPEKSLPVLVQALRLAVDAGVDAHLVLVGEGPMAARLAGLGSRLGVADRLSIIGPFPRAELGGIYASADVFAFPSVVDTQALVLNEAAHESLPLLVSDTANAVVADQDSALVVEHHPAGYAQALARLQDPRLRARLGAGARRLAAEIGEAAQGARLAEVLHRAADADPADGLPDGGVADHGVADHGVADHGVADHGVADHGVADGRVPGGESWGQRRRAYRLSSAGRAR